MNEKEEREVARMQADIEARGEELLVAAYRYKQQMGVRIALVFGCIMILLAVVVFAIVAAITLASGG